MSNPTVASSTPVFDALWARHPHTPCFVSTNTIDTRKMTAALEALPPDHRTRFRAGLGVPDEALLVASVGRLIPQHDPRPIVLEPGPNRAGDLVDAPATVPFVVAIGQARGTALL